MLTKGIILSAAFIAMISNAADARQAARSCYWVDGRLTLGNGTPAIRIWPRGTRRLLGVTTADYQSESDGALPLNVWTFLRQNRTDRVWGSFKVCPLAPDRPGQMRPVTVADARGLRRQS